MRGSTNGIPRHGQWLRRVGALVVLGGLLVGTAGCSVKKIAVGSLAGTFAASSDVFASDEDPELVGDALPFALKTMETLLQEVPKNKQLLLSACQGFTQYGFAYVQSEAEVVAETDFEAAEAMRQRAIKLYIRGRNYGLRGLELDYPGISERLVVDPVGASSEFKLKHIDMMFWTAASWGAAVAAGKDRPDLVVDMPVVSEMMQRALVLDEGYGEGSIHEIMIALRALPPEMGGSMEEARMHYERAVELSEGKRAGTFVTMAQSVSIQTQNKAEFEELLHRALAVDIDAEPRYRLQNILAQRKAAFLLERVDDYILDDSFSEESEVQE